MAVPVQTCFRCSAGAFLLALKPAGPVLPLPLPLLFSPSRRGRAAFPSQPGTSKEAEAEAEAEAERPRGGQRLSAAELAEKVRPRKETGGQSSQLESPVAKRVRELKRLTLHLQRVHPNVLAKALKQGLLYQNEELVVINKPYGVPVQGGPGVKNNISDILPILARMLYGMKAPPLHLCHRLEKETTGVMVLARDEGIAQRIQHFFKTHQVIKKYWAITVGIPVPSQGVIDIPIIEKEVGGTQPHFKMTVSPLYCVSDVEGRLLRVRPNRDSHAAVTRFQVLESCGSSALVELQPITGVKHQLRVHLAFGLGCPILGDHKYSHWDKLAPQKLPEGMLKKLGLEQAKIRHLPLHLHASQLTFPGVEGQQEELNLVCKLPRFFLNTLQKFKLEVPGAA
uniref:Pseudouridylate synthase RPUSD4, mitochondrial n=2 Tax=Latimeria chalumnae TaxID=7897 RepID=H3AS95_LATCH